MTFDRPEVPVAGYLVVALRRRHNGPHIASEALSHLHEDLGRQRVSVKNECEGDAGAIQTSRT